MSKKCLLEWDIKAVTQAAQYKNRRNLKNTSSFNGLFKTEEISADHCPDCSDRFNRF